MAQTAKIVQFPRPKRRWRLRGVLGRLWRFLWGDAPSTRPGADAASGPLYPATRSTMRVSASMVARARAKPDGLSRLAALIDMFPTPEPPPGIPEKERGELKLAMDNAISPIFDFASTFAFGAGILGFMGYPYLAELTQLAEYRIIGETRAKEMTRKWIELEYKGEKPDPDALTELANAMDSFRLREVFREGAKQDAFFGRSNVFIDLKGSADNPKVLMTRLLMKPQTVPKGSLVAFRNVEPIWTYPNAYNAADPLLPDYFKPTSWWVMGKRVHKSRLITLVSRPVPDLLKAAYAFGGLSLIQMCKPYVDRWLRTVGSVNDLIHNFSIVALLTNMSQTLEPGGDDESSLFRRMDFFNANRDNRGIFLLDKDREDIKNVAVPLSGLDKLQAQSQEHMASPAQTPLVKLFGITPTGLNASSDGEIRVYYDSIGADQEDVFREPLTICLDILQLHLWGKIDPDIGFRFVPLWQLDEAGEALVKKTEADIDAIYVESGCIHPEEVRARLAKDPHSNYANLDVEDVPELESDLDKPETSGDPAKQAEPREEERSGV